ncbi:MULTISPECIES: choline/ethanolamine kinase family protein [Glaesserella]|uniref:LPS biosynthesis choline kinase n=1 Tax=Glaesserella australis TaxID=2094024 RepID=A0A328C0E6_9PAST|nr:MULTISPECIES: choline/ethanolamine kinase family protein [Glaesserella]AUI66391.1 LPS biosynthesis choline kinase [Glaesserella sp. 15-184]RAL19395.1 LPS biosynthesis choline kinase [Glaesserella australis]
MKALQWIEQHRQQAVVSVSKLAGLTACSQLVCLANGERYVLRTQTERASNYGINYQQEVAFLRAISPLGFSPKVIYADSHSALLSWIDGQTPTFFDEKCLTSLAERLAQLHLFPLQAADFAQKFTTLNLAERCQFLWQKLPKEKQQMLNFAPPFKPITPFKQTICHHDIHLANLVQQGDALFLIDWEYATISDPALELAMLCHNNHFSAKQKAIFFRHYFAKTGWDFTACIEKMAGYQPEIEKLNGLWFAMT